VVAGVETLTSTTPLAVLAGQAVVAGTLEPRLATPTGLLVRITLAVVAVAVLRTWLVALAVRA